MRVLILVALFACHPKQPKPQPLPDLEKGSGSGSGSSAGPTAPIKGTLTTGRSQKWIAIEQGRTSGYFTRTFRPGGEISSVYHILQNGRGPHVDATYKLAADGTLTTYSATGHHELGGKVAETFVRSGNHVEWKSEEEHGDREVTGSVLYLPMADNPTGELIVNAALKAGGKIQLLPGGTATVTKVGELDVTSKGSTKKLVGYAIRGLDLVPSYVWYDTSGDWFGQFDPFLSLVPEGWDDAIQTILDHQKQLDAADATKLAAATRHVPPAAGIAFTHATVLDIVKGAWVPDQTIVVVGETIKAVGKSPAIPAGAEVVDLAGKRVIPGLIDMHAHTLPQDAILDIACGVTTVRDVGNVPDRLDEMKQQFDAGTAIGPSVVRMGFIEGRGEKAAASKVTAETVDEAKAAVEFYAKRKYEGIKIYNSIKVELVPVLAAEAHRRGMLVIGHVPVHMLANEAVKAGYDGVEHINQMMLALVATHETDTRDTTRFTLVGEKIGDIPIDGKPMRDLLQLFKDKKTVLDPTLGVFEGMYLAVPGKIVAGSEVMAERLPFQIQRGFLAGGLPLEGNKHEVYVKAWDKMLAVVKAMWKAKLHLVAGTDSIGGMYLHHELEVFARAGIPNIDILRIATIEAARGMKLDGKLGSIAVGKRADFAILDGDPLADITQVRTIERTVRAGVVIPAAPLFAAVGVKP